MKTLLQTLTLLLLIAYSSAAFAQEPRKKDHPKKTPQEKAQKLTLKMDEQLNLSDEQTAKVMKVNVQLMEEIAKYKTEAGNTLQDAKERIKDARLVASQQLQSVLSTEQFKKYQLMEEERKANHKNKDGHKSGHHNKGQNASPAAPGN